MTATTCAHTWFLVETRHRFGPAPPRPPPVRRRFLWWTWDEYPSDRHSDLMLMVMSGRKVRVFQCAECGVEREWEVRP